MKKNILFAVSILSLLFVFACNNNQQSATTDQNQTPTVAVKDFDSVAKNYVGKEVIVQGTVSHICKHGGKKMFIFTPPNEDLSIKIVSETSFSPEIEGSDVKVTGKVAELRITAEEIAEMEKVATDAEAECTHEKNKGKTSNEPVETAVSKEEVEYYKDLLIHSGGKYISFFTLEYVKHEVVK